MSDLIVQQDTREKSNKKNHILQYFQDNGIRVVVSKLFVGDYTLLNKQDVCIDVKQNVLEIVKNIMSKDHQRFKDECQRAMNNGIKLIILIEEPYSLSTLYNWRSPEYKSGAHKGKPMTGVSGLSLSKAMRTIIMRYGVSFEFCHRMDTGKRIVELLTNK